MAAAAQRKTSKVAMVTTRPSTPATSTSTSGWAGHFHLQQMDVQILLPRHAPITRWASRVRGQTTCSGTMPRTVDRCSPGRPPAPSCAPTPYRPHAPGAGHRHGREHPAPGRKRRAVHAQPVLQQRRPAGHLLPATSATAPPTSPATTSLTPARTRRSTSAAWTVIDERHRTAGPRFFAAIHEAADRAPACTRCCPATRAPPARAAARRRRKTVKIIPAPPDRLVLGRQWIVHKQGMGRPANPQPCSRGCWQSPGACSGRSGQAFALRER